MTFYVKLINIFQVTSSLLFISIFINACSPTKTNFQSDERLISDFKKNRAELLTIIKQCKEKDGTGSTKDYISDLFHVCKISPSKLKNIHILESAKKSIRNYMPSEELKPNSFLFVTDRYIDNVMSTYVDEKGYVFSPDSIDRDVIQSASLDQFRDKKLIERRSISEEWKFRQIEPNWYLYYRQYYHEYP